MGTIAKAGKLWMVFKSNLVENKKKDANFKNANFSSHVYRVINACDKSVGVNRSKWLWKFARPCQQQFPSADESLGRVNARVWDCDWVERQARRRLLSPIEFPVPQLPLQWRDLGRALSLHLFPQADQLPQWSTLLHILHPRNGHWSDSPYFIFIFFAPFHPFVFVCFHFLAF